MEEGKGHPPRPAHQVGSEPGVLRRPQEAVAVLPTCRWFAPTPRPCPPPSPPPPLLSSCVSLAFSSVVQPLPSLPNSRIMQQQPLKFHKQRRNEWCNSPRQVKGSAFPELIFTLIRNREWKAIEMTVFFSKTISVC